MKPLDAIKPKEGPPAAASEEDDAAADLIAAMKSGDAKAASLALKRHYELCKSGGEEDEYEEA